MSLTCKRVVADLGAQLISHDLPFFDCKDDIVGRPAEVLTNVNTIFGYRCDLHSRFPFLATPLRETSLLEPARSAPLLVDITAS